MRQWQRLSSDVTNSGPQWTSGGPWGTCSTDKTAWKVWAGSAGPSRYILGRKESCWSKGAISFVGWSELCPQRWDNHTGSRDRTQQGVSLGRCRESRTRRCQRRVWDLGKANGIGTIRGKAQRWSGQAQREWQVPSCWAKTGRWVRLCPQGTRLVNHIGILVG